MSSSEGWLARQQRMVKCPRHGLHFDPKMSTGCVRCQKERAKIRVRRAPQPLIILLCVLGIAVVGYRILGPRLSPQEESLEGLEISETATDQALDPSAFRPAIETFENALFKADATTRSDLELTQARITTAAEALRDVIRQGHEGSTTALEVESMTAELQGAPLTFVRLEKLRDRWLQLRRRHLLAADWFHTPAASKRSVAAETRGSVAGYRDIAYELADLLRDSSSEVTGLAGQEDRKQRWRELTEDMNDQLRDITERRPSRPRAGSDDRVLVAFQNLERAFSMARSLGASSTAPADSSGFDEALRIAEDAAEGFNNAM